MTKSTIVLKIEIFSLFAAICLKTRCTNFILFYFFLNHFIDLKKDFLKNVTEESVVKA